MADLNFKEPDFTFADFKALQSNAAFISFCEFIDELEKDALNMLKNAEELSTIYAYQNTAKNMDRIKNWFDEQLQKVKIREDMMAKISDSKTKKGKRNG